MFQGFDAGAFSGYGPVQGALPWGAGGANPGAAFAAAGAPPEAAFAQLAQSYQGAYNSALAQNQSNYDNILAGYQKTLAAQTTAQQAISAGYSGLYNEVQERLAKQGATRAADISAAATADLGRQTQSLIDRGLGNTTVQNAVVRANEFDRQRQQTASAEAYDALRADSARNIGLASLNFQQQAQAANTGLQQQQLDWMNSVSAPYPNAGLYAQLAAQAGQTAQANRNNALQAQLAADANRAALAPAAPDIPAGFVGGPGPRAGYVPSATPNFGGGAYNPAASYTRPTGGGTNAMFGAPGQFASSSYAPTGFDFAGAGGAIASGANLAGWDKASSGFDFGGAGAAIAQGASGGGGGFWAGAADSIAAMPVDDYGSYGEW